MNLFKYGIEKKGLKVVHDDQLNGLLINLGVAEDISQGRKTCKFCKQPVSFENIYAFFPESGDIKIICDNLVCRKKLTEYLNTKEYA